MVVEELIAVLGAKIDEGQFADVFALFDHVTNAALKMAQVIETGIEKGFGVIHEAAMRGDDLARLSEQFGISSSAIQELGYAAVLSDSSLEELTHGMKFLAKAAADAAAGGTDAVKAFGGVKLRGLDGQIRPLEELFTDLSDQFAKMPNGAAKVDRSLTLFGRAGQNLIGTLNRGSKGLAAFREEARLTGQVLSDKAVADGAAYDDAFKRVQGALNGLKNEFATPLISKVTDLFGKLQVLFTSKGMIRAVDALAVGFGRLVDSLGLMVEGLTWLTSNEDVVTGAIFVIASAVAGLTAWAVSMGAAFVGAALSAAASWLLAAAPFLALGALIVLITDDLFTFIEGGDSGLGRLIGWLDSVDPESNPFLQLLKTAGSLLFDLTDPSKWQRFGQAIVDFALSPIKQLLDLIKRGLEDFGIDTSKFNFGVDSSLANVAPALFGQGGGITAAFPGLADPLNLGDQTLQGALSSKFPGAVDLFEKADTFDTQAGNFVSGQFNAAGAGAIPMQSTINAPITIDARGAQDPEAVGEAVRKAVREELGNELSNAQGAIGT